MVKKVIQRMLGSKALILSPIFPLFFLIDNVENGMHNLDKNRLLVLEKKGGNEEKIKKGQLLLLLLLVCGAKSWLEGLIHLIILSAIAV